MLNNPVTLTRDNYESVLANVARQAEETGEPVRVSIQSPDERHDTGSYTLDMDGEDAAVLGKVLEVKGELYGPLETPVLIETAMNLPVYIGMDDIMEFEKEVQAVKEGMEASSCDYVEEQQENGLTGQGTEPSEEWKREHPYTGDSTESSVQNVNTGCTLGSLKL